jgi:hypothetical protein
MRRGGRVLCFVLASVNLCVLAPRLLRTRDYYEIYQIKVLPAGVNTRHPK